MTSEELEHLLSPPVPASGAQAGSGRSTPATASSRPLPWCQENTGSEPRSTRLVEAFGEATRVTCPPDELTWLREFFEPSLSFDTARTATRHLELFVDEQLYHTQQSILEHRPRREFECFTLDGRFERFPGCTTEDGSLLIHLDRFRLLLLVSPNRRHLQLLAATPAARMRLGLMRVLREVVTVAALRAGAIPLHGAACIEEGRAICLLGAKQAGKTTSLVHLLQDTRRVFLANDRFFIHGTEAGLEVRGMPTIVKIRRGTLDLFDGLAAEATAIPWHRERTLNEVQTQPGQPSTTAEATSFSQAQFLKITGRAARSTAPLSCVLFPERDDDTPRVEFRPMAPDEAAAQLARNLLSPGTVLQTSEVFDSAVSREIPSAQIMKICRQIAARACCMRYRQGRQTISHPVQLPASLRAA